MTKIAKFEKVSLEEFSKFFNNITQINCKEVTPEYIKEMYNTIKIPTRATTGSAGYDFVTPFRIDLNPQETVVIPTGIRVNMEQGWFLGCFPKSGLGFKYRCQLDNSVGIIDQDYYYSDNEGHIMAKITNDSKDPTKYMVVEEGKGFMQGIFIPFGITVDDTAEGTRNGGFGSTNT